MRGKDTSRGRDKNSLGVVAGTHVTKNASRWKSSHVSANLTDTRRTGECTKRLHIKVMLETRFASIAKTRRVQWQHRKFVSVMAECSKTAFDAKNLLRARCSQHFGRAAQKNQDSVYQIPIRGENVIRFLPFIARHST
jgi:hypothetical protein